MEVSPENYKNELRYNGWREEGRKSRVQACSVMHSQVTRAFPLLMLHIQSRRRQNNLQETRFQCLDI